MTSIWMTGVHHAEIYSIVVEAHSVSELVDGCARYLATRMGRSAKMGKVQIEIYVRYIFSAAVIGNRG